MRRKFLYPFSAFVLLGCGSASDNSEAPAADALGFVGAQKVELTCEAACPPGTRSVLIEAGQAGNWSHKGAFYVTEGLCESVCAPIALCEYPNAPVFTRDSYSCVTLGGFRTLEAAETVDFSWALNWDAALSADTVEGD